MFPIIFTQAARSDLIEAQDWYETEVRGLGGQFRNAVDAVVARITANPLQFPVILKKARRALVRRFPYALFFVLENRTVYVIACFHAKRNPRQWQRRIQ